MGGCQFKNVTELTDNAYDSPQTKANRYSIYDAPPARSNTTPCAMVGMVSFCWIIVGLKSAPVATTNPV